MECPVDPWLQIGSDPTDQRQTAVHLGTLAAPRNWTMIEAQSAQVCEFGAIVTHPNGSGNDAVLHELIDWGSRFVR